MSLRRILPVCIAWVLVVVLAPAAHALVLTISGTITAPDGSTMPGVAVSDGSPPNAITNASGFYELQELEFGTYTLRVSKAGLTSDSANVSLSPTTPNATKNFELRYLSTLTVADPYVSTAAGPDTISATLSSYAPSASCAKITDSRTGTTSTMTFSTTQAGQQTWTWNSTVPQGTSEGTHTLNAWVEDCAGTQIDTGASPTSYVIDNTAPPLAAYAPQDEGNCLLPCQDFTIIVQDGASGIDVSSAEFELRDPAESVIFHGPMQVSYANGPYVALTYHGSAPLTLGQRYSATAAVLDRAGNELSVDYQFLAIAIEVPTTLASIPAMTGSLSTVEGETLAVFDNVLIHLGRYSVTLTGNEHPGQGYVQQLVDLASAVVSYTLPDGTVVAVPGNSLGSPQTAPFQDRIAEQTISVPETGLAAQEAVVPAASMTAGKIKVLLPQGVTAATLSMSPISTEVDPAGGYPGLIPLAPMGSVNCDFTHPAQCLPQTDPLPLYADKGSAANLIEQSAEAIADSTLDFGPTSFALGVPGGVTENPALYVIQCASFDESGYGQDCSPVESTPHVPTGEEICKKLGCYTVPPPAAAGPPVGNPFTQEDLSAKCGAELPCSSPDSPILPTNQAMAVQCGPPPPNGPGCGGVFWINFGNSVWYTNKTSWKGVNHQCTGNPSRGKCEITTVWTSFSHNGFGDTRGMLHGIGGAWVPPQSTFLYDQVGRIKSELRTQGVGCDYIEGTSRHWSWSNGSGDLPSASGKVYQETGKKAVVLSFPTFPPDYTNPQCEWIAKAGRTQTGLILPNPQTLKTESDSSVEYAHVKRECSWSFDGFEFVSYKGYSIPIPKVKHSCSNKVTKYYYYANYVY